VQREGARGGKKEHDYINHDNHPQKEHIRWRYLCKENILKNGKTAILKSKKKKTFGIIK